MPTLNRETILACTRETSFRRGEKYYREGRVTKFQKSGTSYTATVVGTENYKASLDTITLAGDCDCYAFDGDVWCKHIVALALAAAEGEVRAEEAPQIKRRPGEARRAAAEQLIAIAAPEQLRAALTLVVDRFPDSYAFLQNVLDPPTLNSQAEIMSAVKHALRPVKQARSWEREVEAACAAQEEMEQIARTCPATDFAARGLFAAAQYVYDQLSRIDDSDGTLQEGCAVLCRRALHIVNVIPEVQAALDEALMHESDLPLGDLILEYGSKEVAERFIMRLEKHLYKRDQGLPGISSETAMYILVHHFSTHGDKRLLDLLQEQTVHENTRLSLLARYHEVREEWPEVVGLLWPHRDEYGPRSLLKRAVIETNDTDKLITLQVEETIHAQDIRHAMTKLKHMLTQFGQTQKLPEVVHQLLKNKYLSLENKLWVLIDDRRNKEAVETMLAALAADAKQRKTNSWSTSPYGVMDMVEVFCRQFEKEDSALTLPVWVTLFTLESDRVLQSNRYEHFELFGDELWRRGDTETVRDMAKLITEGYPTRKKLVAICEKWLRG